VVLGLSAVEHWSAPVRATSGSAALRPPKTGRLNPASPAARRQHDRFWAAGRWTMHFFQTLTSHPFGTPQLFTHQQQFSGNKPISFLTFQ